MEQLNKDQYHIIQHLYPDNFPNRAFIDGVIEGILPGKVWVDDINNPAFSLINTNINYCFLGGKFDDSVFHDLCALMNDKPVIKLVYDTSINKIDLTKLNFQIIPRRQYRYKQFPPIIAPIENTSRFTIRQITDSQMIDELMWKDLMIGLYGSSENFLKHGLGYVLWDNEQQLIVCESYGIHSQKWMELGTITRDNYRGQRLSTILCNHVIRKSIDMGLMPVWTCEVANVPSWKIAENNGMNEIIEYSFNVWTRK